MEDVHHPPRIQQRSVRRMEKWRPTVVAVHLLQVVHELQLRSQSSLHQVLGQHESR